MILLKSRYVVPVEAPVIEEGAVLIRDGRIEAVGRARELRAAQEIDYGDAVICPGFVNAHTHLELTGLAGKAPPTGDFADWLRRLMAISRADLTTKEQVQQAVDEGLQQSLASGVTTVADITSHPAWTRPILADSPIRAVSFGEVIAIGAVRDRLKERLDAASSSEHATDRLRIGISPHAPYTVEPKAMRACAERAATIHAPVCIHLAETADEETFTLRREGVFADHLRRLNVWDESIPVPGVRPVDLALGTGLLGPATVVAHANYVTDEDIHKLASSGAAVAYCPRTHHAFAHPPHRFREMLASGIRVCLGTDSLASNPSLSILDEIRFLRREHPDVSSDTLLAMGTLHGARALGLDPIVGSLRVGKWADLVVVPIAGAGRPGRWDRMLETTDPPRAVYIAGSLQAASANPPAS
ncbi:MAG: amidohydrolase family protein [Planctomycetes bacterium]|nr:amidohydrolase family protein [Planctomycetota bacterium]